MTYASLPFLLCFVASCAIQRGQTPLPDLAPKSTAVALHADEVLHFRNKGWLILRRFDQRRFPKPGFDAEDFHAFRALAAQAKAVRSRTWRMSTPAWDEAHPLELQLHHKVQALHQDMRAIGEMLLFPRELGERGAELRASARVSYQRPASPPRPSLRHRLLPSQVHIDRGIPYVLRMRFAALGPNTPILGDIPPLFDRLRRGRIAFPSFFTEPALDQAIDARLRSGDFVTGDSLMERVDRELEAQAQYAREHGLSPSVPKTRAALLRARRSLRKWIAVATERSPERSLVVWSGQARQRNFPTQRYSAHNFVNAGIERLAVLLDLFPPCRKTEN